MKLNQKLTLGFLIIALFVVFIGYISISVSQQELENAIGKSAVLLGHETLDKIDRNIYHRIEGFQTYSKDLQLQELIRQSNHEFEQLGNIQEYIDEKDRQWQLAPKETITPFMQELIDKELFSELKEKMKFYEKKYDYKVFGEVFVTNKYGANAAQTGKTTDYYQADEEWWIMAKENGLYVEDVEYDESAEINSIAIGIRVDDENTNFMGVMKIVLNIEGVISILKELELEEAYETMHFKLITKGGNAIYTQDPDYKYDFLQPVPQRLIDEFKKAEEPHYFISSEVEPLEGELLITHAHSQGYKDYKGLGWGLITEQATEEILAPIQRLRIIIITASLSLLILATLVGLFISRSISEPITKLKDTAVEIGKGKITKVNINSKDEIGELANAFNKMSSDLKKAKIRVENYTRDLEKKVKERTRGITKKAKEAENAKTATINILEDVEETREKLKQSYARLKELEVLKSRFLIVTSHELKTPLTPAKIQTQMLLQGDLGKLTRKQKQSFNIILRNINRLNELIEDILEISRIEAEGFQLKPEKFQLANLITLTVNNLVSVAENKNIKLSYKTGKLPLIKADKKRIIQVLTNLIGNAIKFTEKGTINVETKKQKEDILVKVKDTGIGIPKKYIEAVFDSFFQIEPAYTRKYGGTGLGLNICRGIVEQHKGKIWAESEEGKGSVFYFTLPI